MPDSRSDDLPRFGLFRSIAHRLRGAAEILPEEGRLPSFDRATTWLNSELLTPEGLLGTYAHLWPSAEDKTRAAA